MRKAHTSLFYVGSYNTLTTIMSAHLPLANLNWLDFLLCCLFSHTFPQGKEHILCSAIIERDLGLFAGFWTVFFLLREVVTVLFPVFFPSRPQLHIHVKESKVLVTCPSYGMESKEVVTALTS